MKFVSSFTALCSLLWSASAARKNSMFRNERGPQGNWVSLKDGNQVLVADESESLSPENQAKLNQIRKRWLDDQAGATQSDGQENNKQIQNLIALAKNKGSMKQMSVDRVDSTETFFNEYSQAWRMMGFYIDCNAQEDGGDKNDDGDAVSGCERYLLWGAYVDLDYEGGGLGEYQMWDHATKSWDSSHCGETGGKRCAKMDCHLPETHYTLIGYFKEPNYREWMEQLFKHEGVCAWDFWDDAEIYEAMQTMRETWPEECTQVQVNGDYVYFDLAPQKRGRLDIGLYTDASCYDKYEGSITVADALKAYHGGYDDDYTMVTYGDDQEEHEARDNMKGNSYLLEKNIDIWNDAFDIWHYCNPCKAYDFSNDGSNSDGNQDDHNDNDNSDNKGLWECDDEAGAHNVNQCMKFKTKTKMIPATYNDVMLATEQGTVNSFTSGKFVYGDIFGELNAGAHLGGIIVFFVGALMFFRALKVRRSTAMQKDLQEPFVAA